MKWQTVSCRGLTSVKCCALPQSSLYTYMYMNNFFPFQLKSLTHTPQIFSQFASLNLNAPSNISEIPASLEQLHARKASKESILRKQTKNSLMTGVPRHISVHISYLDDILYISYPDNVLVLVVCLQFTTTVCGLIHNYHKKFEKL